MKARSERISLVLDLARRKEEEAMERLGQARKILDTQTEQLDNLEDYRKQYLQNMRERLSSGIQAAQLQGYQQFIEKIGQAIEQQEQSVNQAQQQFEQQRSVWVEAREKSKSLADLVSRYQHQEAMAKEKRLDKQLEDDYVARHFRNR